MDLHPAAGVANSLQAVHGGVVALYASLAVTAALGSGLAPGERAEPLDLVVYYHRGVPVGAGPLTARATTGHRSRRLAEVGGEILGPDGRPAVRFVSTARLLSPTRTR